MNISPEEAARALGDIEASRTTMRVVIRSHRGHYHLWLWGSIWAAMALLAEYLGLPGMRIANCLVLGGFAASALIILGQKTQVRSTGHKRFVGMLAAIVVFAFVWPLVLRGPANPKSGFAYSALVSMFCYIMAGIWFDIYLLWVGLVVSALILTGLFFFPAIFWWWIAVLCGGTLIGTGFYVRFFWR
ncbi:MAG TPA: hypothetical protein VK717_00640 [Opitutaceae bacterium]|jgi:hypothetical protein|nr:hypothetical protein [Opitutaceae bacterium]